jgi:hypothetical protein
MHWREQTGWMAHERLAELRAQLESIAEELASIGYERLKEAIESGSAEAAAEERRFGRARRSVLKAAGLLGGAIDEAGEE